MKANRIVMFLRAVNVGGHQVVMAELREWIAELGFTDVETFIASGNVICAPTSATRSGIESTVRDRLSAQLDYRVDTFVRTDRELGALSITSPFDDLVGTEIEGSLVVGFLAAPVSAATATEVASLSTAQDRLVVIGRELWWHARGGLARPSISASKMERALGQPTTIRNLTTVRRLAARLGTLTM